MQNNRTLITLRPNRLSRRALPSLLFSLLLSCAAHAANPVGERHTYKAIGERELSVYITKPADWKPGDSRPSIVFFHGGGWVKGKPGQFTEHSKYLASRGLVCVQVEYRLMNKQDDKTPRK